MWKSGEEALSKDKHIAPLLEKYRKCTLVPSKNKEYFSDIVESITGQQISVKAAATIFARLEAYLKDDLGPQKILNISNAKLQGIGYSRQKTIYLKDLSEKVLDGRVEIKRMGQLSDEKIKDELTKVKGIGVWTVEMFLMFSLCRPDIFPVDDLALRKAFANNIGDKSHKEMVEFAKRWSPHRTLASWYLWKSLENT